LDHFHPHPEINSGQALNPLPSRERKHEEKKLSLIGRGEKWKR